MRRRRVPLASFRDHLVELPIGLECRAWYEVGLMATAPKENEPAVNHFKFLKE
jgi:hypothetical protein